MNPNGQRVKRVAPFWAKGKNDESGIDPVFPQSRQALLGTQTGEDERLVAKPTADELRADG